MNILLVVVVHLLTRTSIYTYIHTYAHTHTYIHTYTYTRRKKHLLQLRRCVYGQVWYDMVCMCGMQVVAEVVVVVEVEVVVVVV
ncbi:hypothetical protein F4809DRAFT_607089, partial [Biscogniauxia mediterranea]